MLDLYLILTWNLKAREEPSEDVLAWVRCGQGAKFRHHNSVLLQVLYIRVTVQELTAVGHLTIFNVETMHQGHAIKPMGESKKDERKNNML